MTGARLEVEEFYPFYENVRPNLALARALKTNAQALGINLDEPLPGRAGSGASTDFGNVSQVMPAFELRYAVSREPVASHSIAMRETAKTPYGRTRTYQQVATAIGRPGAYRQVLSSLTQNPIPLLVPCHRVVPNRAGSGSYVAAVAKKEWLLKMERRGLDD